MKSWKLIGDYFLFLGIKKVCFGIGFEIGNRFESKHYCTRDVHFTFGKRQFTFWIEDTK